MNNDLDPEKRSSVRVLVVICGLAARNLSTIEERRQGQIFLSEEIRGTKVETLKNYSEFKSC